MKIGFLIPLFFYCPSFATILPLRDANSLNKNTPLSTQEASHSKEVFYKVTNHFKNTFSPIIKSLGKELEIWQLWSENSTMLLAQQFDDRWIIQVSGGFFRREEITTDSLELALCHELGHHLGGVPKKETWASLEGQADYFATQICARVLWKEQKTAPSGSSLEEQSFCENLYISESQEYNICLRSLKGS